MKYGGVFAPKFITSGNSAPLVSVDLPRSNFRHTTSSVALALRAANGDSPADLDVQSLNDRSFSFVSHEKDREWTLVPSKKRSVSASMQRPDRSYAQIVISAIPVKSAFQRLQFSLGSKNSSDVSVDRPVSDSKVRIERDNRDPKLLTVGTVCARAIEPIFVMGLFIVGHVSRPDVLPVSVLRSLIIPPALIQLMRSGSLGVMVLWFGELSKNQQLSRMKPLAFYPLLMLC
uniref:Uncharacterized protein n=1 Tax=Oryza barthii TaxID=65489 RepID=A0A0D3GGP5_9ORYZ